MATEAYVLVEVDIGKMMEVVKALSQLTGVRSAHSVTGPYDVIAAIQVADLDHLGSLMRDVHSIPGVERTTTCIAVTLAKREKSPWGTLRAKLMKRKAANEPVRTLSLGVANYIDEVGDDYVVVRSERTGRQRRITKGAIESSAAPSNRIIGAEVPGRFPLSELFNIARVDKRCRQVSYVMWRMYREWPEFQKEWSETKVLAFPVSGWNMIATAKKPVRSLEDLRGLKLIAPGKWIGKEIATLGATPVDIPIPEMYTAVEKGVVDGSVIDPLFLTAYGFGEIINYLTDVQVGAAPLYTVMNWDVWNNLYPEEQEIFEELYGDRAASMADDAINRGMSEALQQGIEQYGVEYIELSPEEMARFVGAVQPIRDEYAAYLDSRGYDGKSLVEKFGQLYLEYAE